MFDVSRRNTVKSLLAGSILLFNTRVYSQETSFDEFRRKFAENANRTWNEESDNDLAEAKAAERRGEFASFEPPKQLVPFKDWDYYYVQGGNTRWWPSASQNGGPVTVPVGFVTDLASIPKILWSTGLRPEGAYAYAAIIHDYLYWIQDRSREESDQVFLYAMEDSKVDQTVRNRIHKAVRAFGSNAWKNNAELKDQGERRILKKFPNDHTISWADWKARPDVFID